VKGTVPILLVASVVAWGLGFERWRAAAPLENPPHRIAVAHAPERPQPTDSALDDAQDATVANDPFRLANEPPSVRYDPSADGVIASAPVPLVRPTLTLKAIIGGPPWQAVIDGIPGQPPGTIAGPGVRFDKLVIRSVSRDSVVVQGPDTSWVLGFRGRM
jgi:hypothetical protein